MSRHWKELLDIDKHFDHMNDTSPVPPASNLEERWVYFVETCSFTFQFQSLDQLQECIEFFQLKIHPSSRSPITPMKHWYHAWHERLPQRLFGGTKRDRVIKALERARLDFCNPSPELQYPRNSTARSLGDR